MPLLEIGPGELVDRMTILRLKARHAQGDRATAAQAQLKAVTDALATLPEPVPEHMVQRMGEINRGLWDAEDDLRIALAAVARGEPSDRVAVLAGSIADLNDTRCKAKAGIDEAMGVRRHTEFKIYGK